MNNSKFYTMSDVSDARFILGDKFLVTGGLNNGVCEGHSIEIIEWAKSVIKWFKQYLTVVRSIAKAWFNNDWALATKCIWSSYISKHTHFSQMSKTVRMVLSFIRNNGKGLARKTTFKMSRPQSFRNNIGWNAQQLIPSSFGMHV